MRAVARVGVEPTDTRPSTWPRCQLAYRAINTVSCGSGSRTSASERMKLGRAPAHPQSQAPVSSRADRPHEGQPGTCLAWEVTITISQSPGGDSNSHASGARASEARASTSSATRRVVQRSVRKSNPPLQLEGLMSCADRRTDPRVPGAGIEPAASAFRVRRHYHQQLPRIREGGFEPPPPESKSGSLPVSRFPSAPRGSRTRLSGLGSPRLTARPGTQKNIPSSAGSGFEPRAPGWKPGIGPLDQSRGLQAEGEGVEPSRLRAPPEGWSRPVSSRVPSPVGLSFLILKLRRQESNLRHPG